MHGELMPPSQDPTPPTTGEPSRPEQDNVDQRRIYLVYGTHPDRREDDIGCRPVFLVYGLPIALCLIGGLIGVANANQPYTWPWEVGNLVIMLSMSASIGIPGVLLAMRHPWGALSLVPQRKLRHPRLGGLVQAWIGFLCLCAMLIAGVNSFISLPFFDTRSGALAIFIVTSLSIGAPILALYLFDRRR